MGLCPESHKEGVRVMSDRKKILELAEFLKEFNQFIGKVFQDILTMIRSLDERISKLEKADE